MVQQAYDITALAARWWFIALLLIITIRLIRSLLHERGSEKKASQLAEGYSVGVLEVIEPERSRLYGRRFILRRDNRIGSGGRCDIKLPDRSVRAVHCGVAQRGKRIVLSAYARNVYLNDAPVRADVPLADGDEIGIGDVLLAVKIRPAVGGGRRSAEYDRPHEPCDQLYGDETEEDYDGEYGEQDYIEYDGRDMLDTQQTPYDMNDERDRDDGLLLGDDKPGPRRRR